MPVWLEQREVGKGGGRQRFTGRGQMSGLGAPGSLFFILQATGRL